jgi:Flp pilus assembly protein TadD
MKLIATFRAVVAIIVVVTLTGCAVVRPVSQDQVRRANALVDVGVMHLREMRLVDADAAFEQAFDIAPVAAALDGIGCVALLNGDFDKAEQMFVRAYEMDAEYDQSMANLALLRDIQGRKEEASQLYHEYLSRYPEAARVRNNAALLDFDLNERPEVVTRELQKAATIEDSSIVRENLEKVRRYAQSR